MNQGWQCPGCLKIHAPHVNGCVCQMIVQEELPGAIDYQVCDQPFLGNAGYQGFNNGYRNPLTNK